MEKHVKALAVLQIISGCLHAIAALVVLVVFGGLAGILGVASHGDPDARIAVPILGLVGVALFIFLLLMSIPGIVAGIGLLKLREWARILTIVLSVLSLLSFPFGTALGIYGLWVLLSEQGARVFSAPQAPPVKL